MENIVKQLGSLLFAILFVCLQAAPVFAEDSERTALGLSMVLDSGSADILWVEVRSHEELFDVLETGSTAPLYIRATQDITIPVGEAFTSSVNVPVQLDVGSNTLYVEGVLELQGRVTITGSGGENGLVHVREGGQVYLRNILLKAEAGYAIWQEEWSILAYLPTDECTGKLHFSEKAVATPHSFTSWQVAMPVAVVHDGQSLEEVLPQTDCVGLYRDGVHTPEKDIPVVWELARSQAQLDKRERVLITGTYPDAVAFYTPVCLVTFQNGNPAIFLDSYGTESDGVPLAKVKIELMEPALGCRFEWSQDGTVWQNAGKREVSPDESGRLTYIVSFSSDNPPAYPYYLSAVVDYPDGSSGYSDVIMIQEASTQCDSGGNRGGGTDLNPPDTLPPPMGSGGTGNEEDSTSETPDPPPKKPSGGNTADNESDFSGGKPSHLDTAPSGSLKTEEVPLPPVSSIAGIPKAVTDKAYAFTPQTESGTDEASDAVQTEQTKTAQPFAAQSEPVREVLAPTNPEPPPASNRAVVQVAAGTAATGGVIALTMSYPHWGGRLVTFLRRLLEKH